MKTSKILLLALLLASSPFIQAAEGGDNPPPPPHGDRKGPPPPHFDPSLCKDKAPGATVEVKSPDGKTIKGTCQLVFLPERPPECQSCPSPQGGK